MLIKILKDYKIIFFIIILLIILISLSFLNAKLDKVRKYNFVLDEGYHIEFLEFTVNNNEIIGYIYILNNEEFTKNYITGSLIDGNILIYYENTALTGQLKNNKLLIAQDYNANIIEKIYKPSTREEYNKKVNKVKEEIKENDRIDFLYNQKNNLLSELEQTINITDSQIKDIIISDNYLNDFDDCLEDVKQNYTDYNNKKIDIGFLECSVNDLYMELENIIEDKNYQDKIITGIEENLNEISDIINKLESIYKKINLVANFEEYNKLSKDFTADIKKQSEKLDKFLDMAQIEADKYKTFYNDYWGD